MTRKKNKTLGKMPAEDAASFIEELPFGAQLQSAAALIEAFKPEQTPVMRPLYLKIALAFALKGHIPGGKKSEKQREKLADEMFNRLELVRIYEALVSAMDSADPVECYDHMLTALRAAGDASGYSTIESSEPFDAERELIRLALNVTNVAHERGKL